MTRFQRSRIIKKRKNSWIASWYCGPDVPDNWYVKHHFTDCSCMGCSGPSYIRPRFDWRRALDDQDYAYLERRVIQNGW
jgi:hypothetical protein